MTGLSPAGEAAVIGPLTSNSYLSLHTADPGLTGTGEVTGGAYARQGPVPFTNVGSEPTVAQNNTIVSFPTATAGWGTISFFGYWTAASGGTFLGSAPVATPKLVSNGDQVRFQTGALTITVQ